MRILFGLIISGFLTNCSSPADNQQEVPSPETSVEELIHEVPSDQFQILEIEGCEYLIYKDHIGSNLGFGFMAHKGNCKNLIHCRNEAPIR